MPSLSISPNTTHSGVSPAHILARGAKDIVPGLLVLMNKESINASSPGKADDQELFVATISIFPSPLISPNSNDVVEV